MELDRQSSPPFMVERRLPEEISLLDISCLLLSRKKIILGIAFTVFCIGLLYTFTLKRVYQVETIIYPPSLENIEFLNSDDQLLNSAMENQNGNTSIKQISSSTVFSSFIHTLESRELKKAFFEKYKIIDAFNENMGKTLSISNNEKIFEGFEKSIKVEGGNKNNSMRVTLKGLQKEKIGLWLDDLIELANKETINQLLKNRRAKIDSKIKSLKVEVFSKRQSYKERRADEIIRLQDAYRIAQNLGVHEHIFAPRVDGSFNRVISTKLNSISKSLSNKANLSAYMKGTKVLKAEINSLKNRKSDDAYIPRLRDLLEKLTRLQEIKSEKFQLQTVHIDKKAVLEIEPVYPSRKQVLTLSIILGGMLGIFGVFIVEFANSLKKQLNNN